MKILSELQFKRITNTPINNVLKETSPQKPKPTSIFSKHSEKKKLITEANILAKEAEKESKIAYLLLADFKIAKEESTRHKRKAENIKSLAKYEYKSAKKLLEESGEIRKNETNRKKTDNATYVRVKKKKFGGSIEIDDYTNGNLTRKVQKVGEYITVTAIDLNNNTSLYTFDSDGNLITYFDGIRTSNNELNAKEKFTFQGEKLYTVDIEYKKYGDNSEKSKKHFAYKETKLSKLYKSFFKTGTDEIEISSDELFSFTHQEEPAEYYKKYTYMQPEKEAYKSSFKYETIEHITYLKESRKNIRTENGNKKTYISKFKKRNLKTIYIQDIRTRTLRHFTFDLEHNPINYNEDVIEN